MGNETLEALSHTEVWLTIREFAEKENFWYLRVENLLGKNLKPRSEADWKSAYYILKTALEQPDPYMPEVLSNLMAVDLLIEAGFDLPEDILIGAVKNSKVPKSVIIRLLEDPRTRLRGKAAIRAIQKGRPSIALLIIISLDRESSMQPLTMIGIRRL